MTEYSAQDIKDFYERQKKRYGAQSNLDSWMLDMYLQENLISAKAPDKEGTQVVRVKAGDWPALLAPEHQTPPPPDRRGPPAPPRGGRGGGAAGGKKKGFLPPPPRHPPPPPPPGGAPPPPLLP